MFCRQADHRDEGAATEEGGRHEGDGGPIQEVSGCQIALLLHQVASAVRRGGDPPSPTLWGDFSVSFNAELQAVNCSFESFVCFAPNVNRSRLI